MSKSAPSFMDGYSGDSRSRRAADGVPGFMRENETETESSPGRWTKNDYRLFIHPEDKAAIDLIDGVPGFKQIVQSASAATMEKMFLGECLGTNVKLGPKQLSEYWELLPPICEKFGMKTIPDLFLEMSPAPNAYTFGDKRPFIVVSSGLLEYASKEEVQIVLAHECGHIVCRHPLYNMMATVVDYGVSWIPSGLSSLLKLPLMRWRRMSEFSADRAALAFAGNVEKAMSVIVRISGGRVDYTKSVNFEAYREQLDEYQRIISEASVEKAMQDLLVLYASHPFASVRSYEFLKWSKTPAFELLSKKIGTFDPRCPKCGVAMKRNTNICLNGHFC